MISILKMLRLGCMKNIWVDITGILLHMLLWGSEANIGWKYNLGIHERSAHLSRLGVSKTTQAVRCTLCQEECIQENPDTSRCVNIKAETKETKEESGTLLRNVRGKTGECVITESREETIKNIFRQRSQTGVGWDVNRMRGNSKRCSDFKNFHSKGEQQDKAEVGSNLTLKRGDFFLKMRDTWACLNANKRSQEWFSGAGTLISSKYKWDCSDQDWQLWSTA